ncbi:YraN family protein [Mucisphaera sp.]|uniref:YraN family protein n=1 Tax=Mucisphaera sp. TaxID=2913024 RepID=UPI003D0EF3BF
MSTPRPDRSQTLLRWLTGWIRPVRIGIGGRTGERHASRYLKQKGYRILRTNLRVGAGEIDLLAEAPDRQTIVVVEVKSSASDKADRWRPEDRVGPTKRQQLTRLTHQLRQRHPKLAHRPWRIDIVAVILKPSETPEIRHITNITG